MKKMKVLFVHRHIESNPRFISNDIEILRKKCDLRIYNIGTSKRINFFFSLVRQFVFLIFLIHQYHLIYIWFADYHSFFPVLLSRIFRKKTIICVGGYESTYIPEINCGVYTKKSFIKRIRRFAVAFSLRHCSIILPVDDSLIKNVNSYIYSDIPGKAPLEDGIRTFLPDIRTEMQTVYPGFDGKYFTKLQSITKENIILSVGLITNYNEVKRKGFDILLECAKIMPDIEFVLIGFTENMLKEIEKHSVANVQFLPLLGYELLVKQYSRAKVYSQLSLFEGFPSTICEAMLCKCIPVGSNIYAIPRIIGDAGYIVQRKNIDEIVSVFRRALTSSAELGQKARETIINNYSMVNRERELYRLIERVTT